MCWPGEAKILYYACSFCVHDFFLLSGYLLGDKNEVTFDYCEKKVFSLWARLFGWIVFWSIIHLMRTGEMYDIWSNMTQAIIAGGIEPVAWFLFAYFFTNITPILKKLPRNFFYYDWDMDDLCDNRWM